MRFIFCFSRFWKTFRVLRCYVSVIIGRLYAVYLLFQSLLEDFQGPPLLCQCHHWQTLLLLPRVLRSSSPRVVLPMMLRQTFLVFQQSSLARLAREYLLAALKCCPECRHSQ